MRAVVQSCFNFFLVTCSRYMYGMVCIVVILAIVPLISVQIPMSLVYKGVHDQSGTLEQATALNTARYMQGQHYFRHLASSASDLQNHRNLTDRLQLVICIITVDRSHSYRGREGSMGYLLQTAAVVDHLVKKSRYFQNTSLFVCNVDRSPRSHSEAKLLSHHMHFVNRFGSNSFKKDFQKLTGFDNTQDLSVKGKELEDYIFCLNASHALNSSLVLMLEDDIILDRNFFDVMHYTLKSHGMMPDHWHEQSRRNYSFLKLYYPTRWQGYAFELDRLVELFCTGVLGGTLLLGFVYMYHRYHLEYSASCFCFILGTALTIYCAFIIGRVNVLELRRLSPQLYKFNHSPGCCTQVMLYPRDVVPQLISYLMSHSHIVKDLAITAFAKDSKLPGYSIEPNLAYHIGMFTSLKLAHKPPEEFLSKVPLF